MNEDYANVWGWIVGIIAFVAIGCSVIAWSESVHHGQVESKLAQWPAHQGTILSHGAPYITPQGGTMGATVQFKDYSEQTRILHVQVPDGYRIGNTLPVRVNADGAAFVPQAYYINYSDPTKLLSDGFFPGFAIFVIGIIANFFACLALGFAVSGVLQAIHISKVKGRLGSR